jgi:hypothetical protein
VLELRPRDVAVITCVGDPAAMDALGGIPGATACRVAPDETMLLSDPQGATDVVSDATQRATAADPDAIVLDATDGWAAWTLQGDGVEVAFGRLSAVRLAQGFSQGDVAHVPVKVVSSGDTLDLLVPSMWRAYLRERVLARCAGLEIVEHAESAAWTPTEEDPS